MAEEHFNLLINQDTELNSNKYVLVDMDGLLASNKKVKPKAESKYKAFFYNDIDLVSTDGQKLATLTNNIVVIVLTEDVDGKSLCFASYQYKVTCHGWAAKVPIHITLTDPDGELIKKIVLREIEVYSGCKGLPDTRVEYFDPEFFDRLNKLKRGGDNSRWVKC